LLTAEADDVCLWQPTLPHAGVRSGTGAGDRSRDHDLGGGLLAAVPVEAADLLVFGIELPQLYAVWY